jgi:hypothetical protein
MKCLYTRSEQQNKTCTKNASIGGIYCNTNEVLAIPLQEAFPGTHARHWRCLYRGHLLLYRHDTGNALVGGISSYTYKALEMLL